MIAWRLLVVEVEDVILDEMPFCPSTISRLEVLSLLIENPQR